MSSNYPYPACLSTYGYSYEAAIVDGNGDLLKTGPDDLQLCVFVDKFCAQEYLDQKIKDGYEIAQGAHVIEIKERLYPPSKPQLSLTEWSDLRHLLTVFKISANGLIWLEKQQKLPETERDLDKEKLNLDNITDNLKRSLTLAFTLQGRNNETLAEKVAKIDAYNSTDRGANEDFSWYKNKRLMRKRKLKHQKRKRSAPLAQLDQSI